MKPPKNTKEQRLAARKIYIPKGALHMRLKRAPIDIYLYESEAPAPLRGMRYHATVFVGTQSAPTLRFYWLSAEGRELGVMALVIKETARLKREV